MATEQYYETQTLPAAADYSAAANQFKGIVINTAQQAVLASVLGARCDGVLYNKPGSGQPAELATEGFVKVQAGAATTAGGELAVDATGRFINAVATNYVAAIGIDAAGAAGDIIRAKLACYKI